MKLALKAAALAALTTLSAVAWTGQDTPAHASPTLGWNRIGLQAVERARPTQHQAMRLLAYLSIAQHAAIAEAASEAEARDAVATASAQVIAGLLPSQAAFADEQQRRLLPRSDAKGERIAQRVLAAAQSDRFEQPWTGQPPRAAYAWRSLAIPPAAPAYPAVGAMRTLLTEAGDVPRTAPPPDFGSTRFLEDLVEVRRYAASPTPDTTRIAKFYDMTTGTLVAGFWNQLATELIARDMPGERQASAVLATVNAAMLDSVVACHEVKYTYWVPRPSQADPSIKPIIGLPNHPSYPSNHSCVSTAGALVLAHFFPGDRERLEAIAAEAGVSRIYAGLHYRFDVEAGEDIGRKVAAAAIVRHAGKLAGWTRLTVGANR